MIRNRTTPTPWTPQFSPARIVDEKGRIRGRLIQEKVEPRIFVVLQGLEA